MPTPMAYFGATVYENKIYCISSENGATEIYDPKTDTWESKTPLPNPRIGITANSVAGRIYVVGGDTFEFDVYDPAANSWTTKAPIPVRIGSLTGSLGASIVFNGEIHVIGADPFSNSHQIYNPETESWRMGKQLIAGYYYASVGATAGVNAPIWMYVFGADNNLWSFFIPKLTSQGYDAKTASWMLSAPVPSGHLEAGVAVVNDKLYVVGGAGAGFAGALHANALVSVYTPFGYGTPDPSYSPTTDNTAPEIKVFSPENKSYLGIDILLNVTVSEAGAWTRYKLDGENVTEITQNTTLTSLPYGSHNITVYATDSAGNTATSQTIQFTITKETEPFPTLLAATVAAVSIAIIGISLLVYFKKRKH
jgi:hypothetical protein